MREFPVSPRLLLLGGSGMVGQALLEQLAEPVIAVSRRPPPVMAGVRWHSGDLFRDPLPEPVEVVLSAGPLDGLVAWLTRENPRGLTRVVALSSTSVHSKQRSTAAAERDLAKRLQSTEAQLAAWCEARGIGWTILRPTLIYDDGFRGALGQFVTIARRLGLVALPADARGLRQPVHAADVAAALRSAQDLPVSRNRAYDLPGGEVLDYRRLVARTLAVSVPAARLITLPPRLFALAAHAARRLPAFAALTPEVVARMRCDLVFDVGPATADLGFVPRDFPTAVSGTGVS